MTSASNTFPNATLTQWQSNGRSPTINGDGNGDDVDSGRDWVVSLMEGQNKVLEQIAQGQPLATSLDTLARVIETHSDQELYCSFLLFDETAGRLRHGAAPSLPTEYCEAVDGIEVGPSVGSCGTAAHFTASVIVENIATDPLWANFRELALGFGLRSCWSTPILDCNGQVLATFAMYHPFPYSPTSRDRELVIKATYLARIAIERHQTEVALKEANELLEQKVQRRTRDLQNTLNELKQAQAQVVQSEKMSALGQLLAGVAHEINNPVNFIHGNLTCLQEYTEGLVQGLAFYGKVQERYHQELTPDEQAALEELELDYIQDDLPQLLKSMQMGTERIEEIVRSLRHFSRTDTTTLQESDLHEGLDSTLLILGHRLKAQPDHPAIVVDKQYGPLPKVRCYTGLLNQVFMNILSNAIDAIEERSQRLAPDRDPDIYSIAIATRCWTDEQGKEQVEIAITDRGQGMEGDRQGKIFDPFFTTKSADKGTGLGMSISHRIITQQHHGSLTCESQWGKGTTFRIQIPVHASPPLAQTSPESP